MEQDVHLASGGREVGDQLAGDGFQSAELFRLRSVFDEHIFVAIEQLLEEGEGFVVFARLESFAGAGDSAGERAVGR